jgi:hypothetical protein
MRYRKLDSRGDMLLGRGVADYHQDTPEGVAQAVLTRLRLWRGEWFLDQSEGTPYSPGILGRPPQNPGSGQDLRLRARVLETPGVRAIMEYHDVFDPDKRALAVNILLDTVYGQARLEDQL